MKLLYTLIILSIAFSQALSPCEDEMYLQLKEIKLDKMTEIQFRSFVMMSNECSIYESYQNFNDSLNQKIMEIESQKSVINNYNTYKFGASSLILFLIIHNNFLK